MYLGFTVFKIKCSVQAKRDVLVVAETMASLNYLPPIISNLQRDEVSANVEAKTQSPQVIVVTTSCLLVDEVNILQLNPKY